MLWVNRAILSDVHPMSGYHQFKQVCIACDSAKYPITKEHLWPQWLIRRTNTNNTSVAWFGRKRIPATSATIPLCKRCNSEFGSRLESPVKKVFEDIEDGKGLSDHEAELLIRWLWKFEGLVWRARFPDGRYTRRYNLRQRVLLPIDGIRPSLIIALSRIRDIDQSHGDLPMGIDSACLYSALFVSGVFSRIAMMVLLNMFVDEVPANFTLHKLFEKDDIASKPKLIYPKIGFRDDNEAVYITKKASTRLWALHDKYSRDLVSMRRY